MEKIGFNIGKKIRSLRVEKGLSQEKLSYMAGVDRTYLPDIENGNRRISVEILHRITNALEVRLSDFFKEIDL